MAIAGLQGNEMAQPRVFAHDAVAISGSATQIAGTEDRGCCLYVGTGGSIVVKWKVLLLMLLLLTYQMAHLCLY